MKRIAITMGDAGGIGPEICLRAASSDEIRALCRPCIIGDRSVIEEAASVVGISPESVEVIEPYKLKGFKKGQPTAESGLASYRFIKYAAEKCLEGEFHAMVTSPISKEALNMAGLNWPGHTEMLADLTGKSSFAMMLIGEPIRVVLVTIHIALKDVPGTITEDMVYEKIKLSYQACRMLRLDSPRIGVAGLNPHAGEGGLFGDEEIRVILPAIERARKEGLPVTGPIPPDVIFRQAYKGELDVVVAMYHDQGLIPLKMIAFDRGVNLTLGLPVIRTSPDHGTAYDIAWKGKARDTSIKEAIKLAARLSLD